MSYRVLSLADLPPRDPEEILQSRRIGLMRAARPGQFAEEHPRTLIEADQPDSDGVLAAYMDLKQSKLYPRLRVELRVVLRSIRYEKASLFAVDCLARGDDQHLGRSFHVFNYEAARKLLISFIDYGSTWIDPNWFDEGDSNEAVD